MSDQPLFALPVTAAEIRPGDVVVNPAGSGHPERPCTYSRRLKCRNVQIVCVGNRPGMGPTAGKRIVSFETHRDGDPCGTCHASSGGPRDPNDTWDRA